MAVLGRSRSGAPPPDQILDPPLSRYTGRFPPDRIADRRHLGRGSGSIAPQTLFGFTRLPFGKSGPIEHKGVILTPMKTYHTKVQNWHQCDFIIMIVH